MLGNTHRSEITLLILIIILSIITGFFVAIALQPIVEVNAKSAKQEAINTIQSAKNLFNNQAQEKPSPKDRIKQNDVLVLNNKVIITINNPEWAVFTNTNSMDPVIDENSIAIETKAICDDIQIGDIVSYYSNIANTVVIHRVVDRFRDEKGVYFRFKGDNNEFVDPEKVRCEQLRRVVVGILY